MAKIALRSAHGDFICTPPPAEGWHLEQRQTVGPWSEFQVLQHEDGTISLLTAHGTYVSAGEKGSMGQEPHDQAWERFTPVPLPWGKVALRTAHGTFVKVREGQVTQFPFIGELEMFSLELVAESASSRADAPPAPAPSGALGGKVRWGV